MRISSIFLEDGEGVGVGGPPNRRVVEDLALGELGFADPLGLADGGALIARQRMVLDAGVPVFLLQAFHRQL